MPSTATLELKEPRRIAGLGGHKLLLVEGAVLRRLKAEQVSLAELKKGDARRDPLSEDLALAMGLLIENCARGIDAMAREKAAYWLGRPCTARTPGGCWRRCGCCCVQVDNAVDNASRPR